VKTKHEVTINDENSILFSILIQVPFLCRAAEIITYARPTANPNASGMKTAPPPKFNDCWIRVSNIMLFIIVWFKEYCLTMLPTF
jgi:hypothetical protein